MIKTSDEYKKYILDDRKFYHKANIKLKSGDVLLVDDSKVMEGGIKIEDATSASGKFDVGSAIINKLTLTLNNTDDEYSQYDFEGAEVQLKIGLQLSETVEWIEKGVFTVDTPTFTDTQITLECLDNMTKLEVLYDTGLSYPATLKEIFMDVCNRCGIPYTNADFPNSGYIINQRPSGENLTYREVILYVSQLAGCFARADRFGNMELRWYALMDFEKEDSLDGGSFNIFDESSAVYEDGDNADGGDFIHYRGGQQWDGGTFENQDYHVIHRLNGPSIGTDDILITGIRVTEEFEETEDETDENGTVIKKGVKKGTAFFGTEGYVIEISGNLLIQQGQAKTAAEWLGKRLIGLRFRPMTTQTLSDPSIEAGDIAVIVDRKANTYQTIITNLFYQSGSLETLTADAESVSLNGASRQSELSKAISQAMVQERKNTKEDISNYDKKVQQLTGMLSNALGFYETTEIAEDGSRVSFMHDHPAREDSVVIWKKTIEGFGISTDGGETWETGLTKDGNLIVKVLTTIGINADWITVGGEGNANGVLSIRDDTGNEIVRLGKEGITLANGGKLIGGNGVLSTFMFSSGSDQKIGYEQDYAMQENLKSKIIIDAHIPDKFVVTTAHIKLFHFPTSTVKGSGTVTWGYARNQRLYKALSPMAKYYVEYWMSEGTSTDYKGTLEEVSGAFGSGGFTANYVSSASNANGQIAVSAELSSQIKAGFNSFVIETADSIPAWQGNTTDGTAYQSNAYIRTGYGRAILYVTGYMAP